MLANIISQTIIDEVIGNSEDSLPNKIKEKEESLQNTLNNRLNIPMKVEDIPKVDNDENVSDVDQEVNDVENNDMNREEVSISDSKQFELCYFSDAELLEGNEKPINVKEHMVMNMNQKYTEFFENQTENDDSIIENAIEEVDKVEDTEETYESEASYYGIPSNIEKVLVNTVDFDTTVVAINQTREKYKNVSEQANKAEQDAKESDILLEKISNEYTEAEKQLKEKKLRSEAMEQKIISLLNNEQDRLSQQLHKKESVINNAKKRKEANNDKIVDFKTKISSTLEKANEYDEMISRQEQLLNTLVEFNMNFESDNDVIVEEKNTSKVA